MENGCADAWTKSTREQEAKQTTHQPMKNATVIERGKASRTVRAESAIEGENNGKANQASS
jgi:hypothetical protein